MNKVERHMDICKGLNKIYEQKNHDYGDSFHDTFAEEGMAMARIRLSDKLGRFKKLSRADSEQKVNDESIRDTLLDLANYAIMAVMEMDILAEENKRTQLGEELSKMKDEWEAACVRYTCPACGNMMEWHPDIDKYICGQCGTMYAISASNGAPYIGEKPCEKCTYPGKETCTGCMDRYAWEKKQQRSDTSANKVEQADGQ